MKKWVVTAWMVFLLGGSFGIVSAQDLRIYNDGIIDYVPLEASFVLNAEDTESSLQEIQVSVDGSMLESYDGAISFQTEGRHIIVYRALDRTNNISVEKIYSVIVDGTPPDGSASVDGPVYVTDDGKIYVTGTSAILLWAEDALSGVDKIFVSLDGSDFMPYEEPVVIREEGHHSAVAYAVDNVGNKTSEYVAEGYVDSTPPAVNLTSREPFVEVDGNNYTNRDNVYTVTARDAYAGTREILVSLDGSDYFTYTGPFKVQLPGRHSLSAKAVDNLGNESDAVSLSFSVDVVPPDTSMGVSVE
jgi:hypothetical protein